MIIVRTPFRISLAGGGSDLRAWYETAPGAVVSTTINKYMYTTVNRRFDSTVRVSYTRTEIVPSASSLAHELVREAMLAAGVANGVEVTTIADVPAGTGLGSSSSLTVGLLQAFHAYQGAYCSAEQLAREACRIETEVLAKPIGKQDQYAAAYGGLNYYRFDPDGTVQVEPVVCRRETRAELESRLMMFFIGQRSDEGKLLAEQRRRTESDPDVRQRLQRMVNIASAVRDALRTGDLDAVGGLLHENWVLKKGLCGGIATPQIDRWYESALEAGGIGGKILGAGGAGFLLIFCRTGTGEAVRNCLEQQGLRHYPVRLETEGSRVLFYDPDA